MMHTEKTLGSFTSQDMGPGYYEFTENKPEGQFWLPEDHLLPCWLFRLWAMMLK